jgi:hypothetical protein
MTVHKARVIITHEIEINDEHYIDPVASDYPLTEQVQDEIVNSMAQGDDIFDLSDGDILVEIHD